MPDQRFTVSTDPDGKSYLFGRNYPETDPGFVTGGLELNLWSDEAVDALRKVLATSPENEPHRIYRVFSTRTAGGDIHDIYCACGWHHAAMSRGEVLAAHSEHRNATNDSSRTMENER